MTANLRIFLWVLLGMTLFMNYQTWEHDYPPVTVVRGQGGPPTVSLDSSAPTVSAPVANAPTTAAPAATGPAEHAAGAAPLSGAQSLADSAAVPPGAGQVHVRTDVLDVEVALAGGELERVDLPVYPLAKNQPNEPVRLLNRDTPASLFVLQSGLAGSSGEAAPTHQAAFTSDVTLVDWPWPMVSAPVAAAGPGSTVTLTVPVAVSPSWSVTV